MISPQLKSRHPESPDIPLRTASQALAANKGWSVEEFEYHASEITGNLCRAEFFLSYKVPGLTFGIGGGDFHYGSHQLKNGYARLMIVLLADENHDVDKVTTKLILAQKILAEIRASTKGDESCLFDLDGGGTDITNGKVLNISIDAEALIDFPEDASAQDLYNAYLPILTVVTDAIDRALTKGIQS